MRVVACFRDLALVLNIGLYSAFVGVRSVSRGSSEPGACTSWQPVIDLQLKLVV